jgi:NAD(P)-dependent dehydrogenase (short-subunit alcohol dehydrogenase family)
MDIKNKLALITGGASGMGAATAKALASRGAKTVILDTNIKTAHNIAQDIAGEAFECDVTKEAEIEAVINKIIHCFGIPQICINCAGIISAQRMVGKDGPMPLEGFKKVININLIGTFNVMRIVAAAMTKSDPLNESSERGVIINTASIAAYEGQIGQVAYSASKGGITAMTLPAARELAQFGIRVMTIAPGLVDTPMFDNLPFEAKQALAKAVPFPNRLATAEEYAYLACHIIENPMLNGSTIRLDGALRMPPK